MFKKKTWERGFIANSGTDKNSSAKMYPFEFRSSWQNLWYSDTISCCVTELYNQIEWEPREIRSEEYGKKE